ncbi:MAG: hypothetical protein KC643_31505 [Nitrospira sp.]|nr:hypothetical protein [Nitrospira sp.]
MAEQEARKKWDRAYSDRPKNKGGRPKEDEQSRIFFFEVLKETGGKLPKYQRHKSYWVDEVNKKWLKQTGRQRDPRAIGRAIQPIIEKLPPAYKPSREQTMGIRDPFEFTEEMFQKNLDAMIGHIHIPRIKKEVPFIDLWDLGLSKYPRVYKKITKNYAKDSLLKLFIDVHIRVCKLLLKMANTPASRGQQIRWLRQALPMYFEP